MSVIYKLNYILNNKIKKIYVFTKNKTTNSKTGLMDYENKEIFTSNEWGKIRSENIPFEIIKCNIYKDDTIRTIKDKLIIYLDLNISLNEIYFFATTLKRLNITAMYNEITQNELIELKYDKMCDFLNNIRDLDYDLTKSCDKFISKQSTYVYDDLNDIDINWNNLHKISIPIGQKIIFKKNYPFNSNPYHNEQFDTILKEESLNLLSTQNNYVLFQFGKINENNINFCLANDIIEYSKTTFKDESYLLKIYFSQLYVNDKIKTLKDLEKKRNKLIKKEDKKRVNLKKHSDIIDLLYDIEEDKSFIVDYISTGIKKLHFTIHPYNLIKLPLEILFKIIHSNEQMPLIKYNPGTRLENIYRLYTGKHYSTNGSKIPQLYVDYNNRKIQINKLSKDLAKKKRVGYYIKDDKIYALCEFLENGNIEVKLEMMKTLPLNEIIRFLDTHINKLLLDKINIFLEQSGYSFTLFKSLYDDNIEINDITYEININYNEKININNYISCLSSIFNVHKGEMKTSKDEINLTYKRVSSFHKMNSINAFITICRRNNMGKTEILENLQNNFSLSVEQSEKELQDWQRNVTFKSESIVNREVSIESNPGFDVIIKSNLQRTSGKFNQGTQIIINNIDNINYIEHIKIYCDSMFKIIFDDKNEKIKKMCKGTKKLKDIIQSTDLKNEREKDILNLQKEETSYVEESDDDEDVMDLLYGAMALGEDVDGDGEADKVLDLQKVLNDNVGNTDVDEQVGFVEGEELEYSPPGFSDDEGDDEGDEEERELETKTDEPPGKVKVRTRTGDIYVDPSKLETKDEEPSLEQKDDSSDDEPVNPEEELQTPPSFSDDDGEFPEMIGGKIDIELEGLPLSGSKSIFRDKRQKLESKLFLKRDEGKFKAYSKACPTQYKKQPIMLTKEEKEYIDKKDNESNSSSYDEHITYGTGDNKYHYICPRFWCIRDNDNRSRSLTLDQVNKGECGGWDALIPENAKKIPKGKRIYEFTDKQFHRSKSKTKNPLVYKQLYPGFMDTNKHPDGLCVPCCYEKPFTCKVPDDWKEIDVNGTKKYVKKEWIFNEGTKKPVNKGKTRKDKPLTKSIQEGWYHVDDKEFKKKLIPEKECPAGLKLKNMYKPGGPNDGGPGFNRDGKGNIDINSINNGTQHTRPVPKKGSEDRYKSCNQGNEKSPKEEKKSSVKKVRIKKKYLTDKAPLLESFPLQQNQTGYLPITLQKFLGYNSREICQKGSDLKNDKFCLLRYGVLQHDRQSFLACIAYLYNDKSNLKDVKKEILKNITLDKFISVYNGVLVTIFEKEMNGEQDVDIDKYKDNIIVKKIKEEKYIKKIILSFENFINYLSDDNIKIDYEYLWDFICQPKSKNGLLFDKGINMLILKNPSDDMSDKIELICPRTDYSTTLFDKSLDTIILYTKNDYFEPICQIKKIYGQSKRVKTQTVINKFFTMDNIRRNTPEILDILLQIVNENLKFCLGEKSLSKNTYNFDKNKSSQEIIDILEKNKYVIDNQVINFNNQVIALIVLKNNKKIYVPVLPSSLNVKHSFIYIKNPNIYFDYDDTYKVLLELSKKEIPCKPIIKIISDEMVVGIVTQTNQFVPVIPIIKANIKDKLKVIENEDILKVDNNILENDEVDENRIIVVKKIKLESNFYNMFRNSFKLFLSNKKNRDEKLTIIETINDIKLSYMTKLELITNFIKNIMKDKIKFVNYKIEQLKDIDQLFKCFGLDKKTCGEKLNCSFNEKGSCSLLLPNNNLLSGDNNSKNYYIKLSDEIIRFTNIRKYLFTPRTFLSFENVSYNLTNEEIILLEDVLLNKYFEDLVSIEFNKYISNQQIFETTNPIEHIPIKTIFDINSKKQNANVCTYDPRINLIVKNRPVLHNLKNTEIEHYKQSAFCTFQIVLDLINKNLKEKGKKDVDIITLKKELFQEIINLKNTQDESVLYDIFIASSQIKNKKNTASVLNNESQLETHISSAEYFVTEIDMYILFKKYKINAVLITTNSKNKLPISNKHYFSFIQNEKPVHIIICNAMWTKPTKNFPDKAVGSASGYPRYGLLYLNSNNSIEQKYINPFIDEIGKIESIDNIFSNFKVENDKKLEEKKKKGRERIAKFRKLGKIKKIKKNKKGGNTVRKMKRRYELP
jgi:hypothetical protein